MGDLRWAGTVAVAVAACLGIGCGGEPRADAAVAESAAAGSAEAGATAAAAGWVPGTPPGDLERWVGEIREGIRTLPGQAGGAAMAARDGALQLYVGRQEYLEIYYGPDGRLARGSALGEAIDDAEARFHELMQLLGATPAPDSAAVATAVAALDAQYERVLAEARAAGVADPPPPPAGGGDR